MIKRIVLYLICISLLWTSVPSMADTNTDDDLYSESKALIEGLGIVEAELFECDDYHSPITRGEMAKYVTSLLGIDPSGYGFVETFTDVTDQEAWATHIHICHSLGILSGFGDQSFRPNDTVTVTDAVKIIVCALGYDTIAKAKGGYPGGYLAVGAELGITLGMGEISDSQLCRHRMARIFENALFAPMAVEDVNGGKFTIEKNADTLLLRHGIYCAIGKVTGNQFSTLTTKGGVGEGKIRIGDEIFHNPKELNPIMGSRITYYYKFRDDNVSKELVYFTFDQDSVITLDAGQIVDYDNNILYYMKGNTVKEKKIAKDSDVIYNNSPLIPLKEEHLEPKTGTLTLIDSDSDGVCDTVVCKVYDNYVVQSVDSAKGIIYDRYDREKTLTIKDDSDFCRLYDRYGTSVSASSLTQWDVVTAFSSEDGHIVDAYINVKEIEGSPLEVGKEDGKRYVVLERGKYFVAESYKEDIVLGEKCLFYLDIFGDIAAARSIRDAQFEFGYLLGAKPSANSMESGVMMQILGTNDSLSVIYASDKIFVDDALKKTKDEKLNALSYLTDEVVWYSLDNEGNINKIYSPKGNAFSKTWSSLKDEDGNRIASPTKLTYRSSSKILEGKVAIDDSTRVFLVPLSGEAQLYRATKPTFTDGLNYSMDAYKINDDTIVADILVQYYDGVHKPINGVSPVMIVENVTLVKNADGMPVQKITGLVSGYKASYETADENVLNKLKPYVSDGNTYKVQKGDMIRFATDSDGKIKEGEIIYKAETNTLFSPNPNSSAYFQGTRVSYSQVYKANGGFMMLTPGLLEAYDNQTGLEIFSVSKGNIYRYDSQKEEISVATGKDIRGFVNEGANASKVIVWTISANPSVIYIID